MSIKFFSLSKTRLAKRSYRKQLPEDFTKLKGFQICLVNNNVISKIKKEYKN